MRWTVLPLKWLVSSAHPVAPSTVLATAISTALAAALICLPGGAHAQRRPGARPARAAKPPKVDVPALSRTLAAEDTAKASAAAEALGKAAPEPAALGALLDALALGLNPTVAAAALAAVAAHKSAQAFDTVEFYLSYRDPRVRAAAVETVGALDDPRASSHVMAALSDLDKPVRAAAIAAVASRNLRRGIEPMLELLKRGDEATVEALATMADADVARAVGEFIGIAPDFLVARTLGLMLLRTDFGPETTRVQVVRTLGKVPGPEVVVQLTKYIESIPANPPRQSRREAEALVQARVSEGGK